MSTNGFGKHTACQPAKTFTAACSHGSRRDHAPSCNLIDLDCPMYGTTVVKCGGKKFDLEVVRKALALAAELGGGLRHG